ncbi:hypothetical protein QBC46DRAFT_446906 [Diplogelasinospora grovesii]|uniref:HbrB-like protein n=1 Tax=Diplogelasinospora grovesii TaxID=303347 RepID=A0AAN6NEE7_9PEZI|nr:hypothetical protein QBC46DRAFT_446906 [Diplogelasinospora grovesii]
MQQARPPPRAPGSFSPLPGSSSSAAASNGGAARPPQKRMESSTSSSDNDSINNPPPVPLNVIKPRAAAVAAAASQGAAGGTSTPIYASFATAHNNSSATSLLQNFSRPTLSMSTAATALSAARSVAATHSPSSETTPTTRNGSSPLTLPPKSSSPVASTFSGAADKVRGHHHSRKHSQNAGLFEPTLPSTNTSNLSQVSTHGQPSPKVAVTPAPYREMSASQIAAQAAVVMHHQNQQQAAQAAAQAAQAAQQQAQQQALQLQHTRQRSQTVPVPGADYEVPPALGGTAREKRGSGGPLGPPVLSLTEASAPRESGFGAQSYHNGLLGSYTSAATTAANVVFPRSGQSSPGLPTSSPAITPQQSMPPPEKPIKSEKSKVKLFSRPGKIGVKGGGEASKDKPLPSPSKIGQALSNLQRGNFSTTSLDSSAQSFYSLGGNSSTATIKALDTSLGEGGGGGGGGGKEKEKKHHFLSRQKHKLKDDYHLPLSSASSNSRPTDPTAPSSLYNFSLPPGSPGPSSTGFKTSLDLRHPTRSKKKDAGGGAFDDAASSYNLAQGEWPGPSSVNSGGSLLASSIFLNEPFDSGKYGLNNMTHDDAWPFLKAKLLVIFEGEDLRLPVEDFNRIVTMHIQYCLARRSPNIIVEDLRELLSTGFASLDQTLRKTPEDRLIPALVELWIFTFTSILPYMQAVFLPLDLEFGGNGPLMTGDQAQDFWGGTAGPNGEILAVGEVLEVRRIVLLAFRDIVILPRYETLRPMFSRLSLEFLPQSLASMALASPVPVPSGGNNNNGGYNSGGYNSMGQQLSASPSGDSSNSGGFSLGSTGTGTGFRPSTAMSTSDHHHPSSLASYHSNSFATATLLDERQKGPGSSGSPNRSRAISNVSYGSDQTGPRPFTPSSLHALGGSTFNNLRGNELGARDQNVEDSKQVTEMVGRMLQCMSVLASVGISGGPGGGGGGAQGGGGNTDEGNKMIEELNKLLKLNWLGRGRTGRNRRGIVGGRVKRGGGAQAAVVIGLGVGVGGGSGSPDVFTSQL